MATVYKSGNQWVVEVYKRGRIRAGSNQKIARQVHTHVEQLEECQKFNTLIPDSTQSWIQGLDHKLRDRLIKLGLAPSIRHRTLGDLTRTFRKSRKKHSTTNLQTMDSLLRFFDEEKPLHSFTILDVENFRTWLQTKARKVAADAPKGTEQGIAPATVSARVKKARQIFKMAVKAEWIKTNPFEHVVAGKQSNPSRSFYVSPDLAAKILDELPSVELRLIFALGRWAGFRLPSEAYDLKWSNVNWERSSMTFRSRKTEHNEGHEIRSCPIFTELRPYLDAAWDALDGEPAKYCCPWLRKQKHPGQSFTKQLRAALRRLGVKPWPRLLNNLRATRATEVADKFGLKTESEWIGHGADVALLHYIMVTDEKWEQAIESEKNCSNSETLSSRK